jgi:hypothetical protein
MRNFQTAALEAAMQANEDAAAAARGGGGRLAAQEGYAVAAGAHSSSYAAVSRQKAGQKGRNGGNNSNNGSSSSSSRSSLAIKELPKHVSVLLAAFAEARQQPSPALGSLLLAAAAAGDLSQQETRVLVELLVSLGELQLVPDTSWLALYCRASVGRLEKYSGWQVAASVFAFGKLQRALEGLRVGGVRKGLRGDGGTWASQSTTFAALVEQSLQQQQWQRQQGKQQMEALVMEEVGSSTIGHFGVRTSSKRGSSSPCLWALQEDLQQWMETALSCLPRELPRMAARDLADLLFGLALLQWPVMEGGQQIPATAPAAGAGAAGETGAVGGVAGVEEGLVEQLMQEVLEKLRRFNATALAIVLDSVVGLQQQALERQQQQPEVDWEQQQQQGLERQQPPQQQQGLEYQQQQQEQEQQGVLEQQQLLRPASFLTDAWLEAYLAEVQQKLPVIGAEDMRRMLRALAAAGVSVPQEWVTAAAGHLQGKLTLLDLESLVDVMIAVRCLGFSPSQAWLSNFMVAVRGALQTQSSLAAPALMLQLLKGLKEWGAEPGEMWVDAVRKALGQYRTDWMLEEVRAAESAALLVGESVWGSEIRLQDGLNSSSRGRDSGSCQADLGEDSTAVLAACEQVLIEMGGDVGTNTSEQATASSASLVLVG